MEIDDHNLMLSIFSKLESGKYGPDVYLFMMKIEDILAMFPSYSQTIERPLV